jgi:hypothetical protein
MFQLSSLSQLKMLVVKRHHRQKPPRKKLPSPLKSPNLALEQHLQVPLAPQLALKNPTPQEPA